MPSTIPTEPRAACGVSGHPSAETAAALASEQCVATMGDEPADLALLFISPHHAGSAASIASSVRARTGAACMIGVSGESVVGGQLELERVPGVSILTLRAPGATFEAFSVEQLTPVQGGLDAAAAIAARIGVDESLRATIFFADPFSVPMVKLLPAMSAAMGAAHYAGAPGVERRSRPVLLGGMASGSSGGAGGNRLIMNDRVMASGGVGVSIKGALRVDTVVSQGCRPFGPPMVITKARGNIILQLAGRPALEAVHEAVGDLPEEDRQKLQAGLFVGRVINEYKDRFGRGDFLIRNVMGVDQKSGALAVGDLVKTGQTIRLHFRDATTASEDLSLLMDAQKLYDRPAGALLITCNGRGSKLFGRPNHDVAAVLRAFAPASSGEELAKSGHSIAPASPGQPHPIPLAGFVAAGEIGPIGGGSFLHGQSACVALFRGA